MEVDDFNDWLVDAYDYRVEVNRAIAKANKPGK